MEILGNSYFLASVSEVVMLSDFFKAPESAILKIKFLNRVRYEAVPREIT